MWRELPFSLWSVLSCITLTLSRQMFIKKKKKKLIHAIDAVSHTNAAQSAVLPIKSMLVF